VSPIKSAKAFGVAQEKRIVVTDAVRFIAISDAPFVVVFGGCSAQLSKGATRMRSAYGLSWD
jgi:hypothetical protein